MKLEPIGRKVVLRGIKVSPFVGSAGLVVPPSCGQFWRTEQEAVVVAVGPDVEEDLRVGDRVVYAKKAGDVVEVDGQRLRVVSDTDIYGVIDMTGTVEDWYPGEDVPDEPGWGRPDDLDEED